MKDTDWIKIWTDNYQGDPSMQLDHLEHKRVVFQKLKSYTGFVKNMLDIGCGIAREAKLFQETYGTNLYLLDGDFDKSLHKNRSVNYGSVEDFKFYSKISDLKKFWNSQGMKYNFIDANNIQINESLKFDLIYSAVSCGFHYPASTYKDLILKHSCASTKIIFDIRKSKKQDDIKIIKIILETKKFITAQIEFK